MYTHKTISSFAVYILFISILVAVSHNGSRSRVYNNNTTLLTIDSPEKAYSLWSERKLHGRILILFDNYPHAKGLRFYDGPPQLTSANLIEFSIFKNIIRKIYYVVPNDQWNEFRQQKEMNPIREVIGLDQGVYLNNLNGMPLIAVTPSSLPAIHETVLVFANIDVFDPSFTANLLENKKIKSDVSITYLGAKK